MANLGDVTVAGNLVEDPKRVSTRSGRDMVVLRLAENKRVRDRETNEWRDADPVYWDAVVNRERLGANVEASLGKGDRVVVQGLARSEPYVTRDGEAAENLRIRASEVAASLQYTQAAMSRDVDRSTERVTGRSMEQDQPERVNQASGLESDEVAGWEPRQHTNQRESSGPSAPFGHAVIPPPQARPEQKAEWDAARTQMQMNQMNAPGASSGGPSVG